MVVVANNIALSGIVLEPVSREKYENWSTLVKNYLAGQDLWDNIIVDSGDNCGKDSPDWKLKNSKALHVIQLSCGQQTLPYIRHYNTAKEAWSFLRTFFGDEDLGGHLDMERVALTTNNVNNDLLDQLHSAVKKGLWNEARWLMERYPTLINNTSSWAGRSVLHVAVASGQEEIVKNLVEKGGESLVKMKDGLERTALALAAELTDNAKMAKWMISKGGEELVTEENDKGEIPVIVASAMGHRQMTRYLFSETPWSVLVENDSHYASLLLSRCISAQIFDVAAALVQHDGARNLDLAVSDVCCPFGPPIYALTCIPLAFCSGTQLGITRQFLYRVLRMPTFKALKDKRIVIGARDASLDTVTGAIGNHCFSPITRCLSQFFGQLQALFDFDDLYVMKMRHYLVLEILKYFCARTKLASETELRRWLAYDAILQAANNGIVEFIDSMREANPNLLWVMDKNRRGILAHAIVNRQEKVVNLILQTEDHKEIIASFKDAFGNNILHLAAELGPSCTGRDKSSAPYQMIRELMWFKAVMSIVPPMCNESKNELGFTPRQLFTISHEQLTRDSEQLVKDISTTCITIGTVIMGLMFAAATTVPGANDQNKGTPILLGREEFDAFTVAVAVSLFTSLISVLMFMAILTSRNGVEDLIRSLLFKFIGIALLLISVMCMILAFYTALLPMVFQGDRWILAMVAIATIMPFYALLPFMRRHLSEIQKSVGPNLLTTKKKSQRF